jgi:GMP synthase-like glutamine amidotransferase
MRIGLLQCDEVAERFRPVAGTFLESFGALLRDPLPDAELVPYDVMGGVVPGSPGECDAWLCTGSRFSAYDDEPWIDALSDFIRSAHDAAVPLVGICFGHQVLAQALGGRVERAATGWGAGVHRLHVVDQASWMDPPLGDLSLLFMHQDQVAELPPGATLRARTDHCPNAMFELGSSVGLQAHPEFVPAFIAALVEDRVERIGAHKSAAALESLAATLDAPVVGQWLARVLAPSP